MTFARLLNRRPWMCCAQTVMAAQEFDVKTVMLGGGVAPNRHCKNSWASSSKTNTNTKYFIQDTQYYADNAAMIAAAGYFQTQKNSRLGKIDVDPNWEYNT